jgi:hypothetical protein
MGGSVSFEARLVLKQVSGNALPLMEKRMGGEHGRAGGWLSGAARNRALVKQAILVREVALLPAPTSKASKNSARALPAVDDSAYALVRRSMAEVEQKELRIAELEAEKAQTAVTLADLERRLADRDRRRYDFESAPLPSAADLRPALRERVGAPRIIGSTPDDRAAISGVKRGAEIVLKPKVSYGGYEMGDVFSLGQQIKDGKLTLADIRNGAPGDYAVPYGTMYRWMQPVDALGTPKWLHARDVQRLTKKPRAGGVKGGGTVLGATAEKKLMVDMADAAAQHCPYTFEEVEDMVRAALIETGTIIARTGQPYTLVSDVSTLLTAILRRAAEQGVYIVQKNGRKLGLQRHINQNYEALKAYAAKVNPLLLAFQQKYGVKLTLFDVGNWDETGLDLCAFARGLFLFLKGAGNQVVVPFEQSPHWTLVVGFVGKVRMQMLAIMKGSSDQAPSPYHAQLLQEGDGTFLAQSETGWITAAQKVAYFKLQVEAGIIGKRPLCINVDGHVTNFDNKELEELAREHQTILLIPPSHTSAAVNGMGTQQGDRPAHQGGPIALLKRELRGMLRQHFGAALRDVTRKSNVSAAEILAIVARAWASSFDPSLIDKLNADVGYYINEEGFLQYDLTRLLPVPAASVPAAASAPAAAAFSSLADQQAAAAAAAGCATLGTPETAGSFASAPELAAARALGPALVTSRAFGRHYFNTLSTEQSGVIERARADVKMIVALENARVGKLQPVVPLPQQKTRRDAETLRHSKFGCVVGSDEHRAAVGRAADNEAAAARQQLAAGASKWARHRAVVLKAEAALVDKRGNVAALNAAELKALVLSRTGRWPKATSFKDGSLLAEAEAAVLARSTTLMPPTPPAAAERACDGGGGGDAAAAAAEADAWACESCDSVFDESTLPALDENNFCWCSCGAPVSRAADDM